MMQLKRPCLPLPQRLRELAPAVCPLLIFLLLLLALAPWPFCGRHSPEEQPELIPALWQQCYGCGVVRRIAVPIVAVVMMLLLMMLLKVQFPSFGVGMMMVLLV